MKTNQKQEGQWMTPKAIVDIVLDSVSYTGSSILEKTIMEPSFGSGAFLVKILERIVNEGTAAGKSKQEIADVIRNNVFGIEKDKSLCDRAISRLNNFLNSHELPAIEWDNLVNGDALKLYKGYQGRMDFVVGNPPFVTVHNLSTEYRELIKNTLRFSSGTMDLYIAFYEMGLPMLGENGRLGYISPNSFLRNASQQSFRDFLINNEYISAIYDIQDTHIFDADTHTCICVLDKTNHAEREVRYGELSIPFCEFKERFRGSTWDLCSEADMEFLEANSKLPLKLGELAAIQNAVSTQRNDVYVLNAYLDEGCTIPYTGLHTDSERVVFFRDREGKTRAIESKILRRCVKASRFDGEWNGTYILFPYKEEEKGFVPLTEEELKSCYPKAYDYLLSQKKELLERDRDKHTPWFCFGRSQGLTHLGTRRIVFKHLISDEAVRVTPYIIDEDMVVYSGYYVACAERIAPEMICNIIASDDFLRYCKLKGKNKTGGYVEVSSKSVKQFGLVQADYP